MLIIYSYIVFEKNITGNLRILAARSSWRWRVVAIYNNWFWWV